MGQDVQPEPSLAALLRDLLRALVVDVRLSAYRALVRLGLGARWRERFIAGLVRGQGAVVASNGDTVFASVSLATGDVLHYAYSVSPSTPVRLLPVDALIMARGHIYRPQAPGP